MSFLKRLFGGGDDGAPKSAAPAAAEEAYRDCLIRATPQKEGGQFRLVGTVSRGAGETLQEHRFLRADLFQTADEAAEAALRKGRQLVDEQGDGLFRS